MSQDHNSEHAYTCPGVLAIRVTLQLLWRSAKESVPVLNEGKFYEKKSLSNKMEKIWKNLQLSSVLFIER